MEQDHRTPNLRALALAVTVLSALTATLLVSQASLAASPGLAGYGIDETLALSAEGYGR
jgi:hypothetical protein